MSSAVSHAGLVGIGFLVILEGFLLALFPKALAFLGGPGATRPELRNWNRYQGMGFMLLGASFTMSALRTDPVPVLVLAMVACLMFSLAVVRRSQAKR